LFTAEKLGHFDYSALIRDVAKDPLIDKGMKVRPLSPPFPHVHGKGFTVQAFTHGAGSRGGKGNQRIAELNATPEG
jgi:hypothetical protein